MNKGFQLLCLLYAVFILSCSSVKINVLSSDGSEEFNGTVENRDAEIILLTGLVTGKDLELKGRRLYWTETITNRHQSSDIDSVRGVRIADHWGGAFRGLAIGMVIGTNYFTVVYLKRLFSPSDITVNDVLKDFNTSLKFGLVGGGLGTIIGSAIGKKTIKPCLQTDSTQCDDKDF